MLYMGTYSVVQLIGVNWNMRIYQWAGNRVWFWLWPWSGMCQNGQKCSCKHCDQIPDGLAFSGNKLLLLQFWCVLLN